MYDGEVRIGITVNGQQVDVASGQLDNLEASGRRAGEGARETEDGMRRAGNESGKATDKVKKFATALGLVAIAAAAFQTLRASMDDAIKRFDILNNYPRVLSSLGVDADDAEASINNLSDGIDGLPTKLDDIAATAQRMYSSFSDIDKATDSALALNNALLANGSSAADAQRGTEQYLQMLQTGQVDMQQWRTLQETMDVSLNKVAESFGYAGRSATNDLYSALQDGSITVDDLNDKLIELGTGTGELAELARTNSQGIATSFGNLRYAAARGLTNIIEAFNDLSIQVTGNSIAENIDNMKDVVYSAFTTIADGIRAAAPVVQGFMAIMSALIPVIQTVAPIILGIATAHLAVVTATKLSTAAYAAYSTILRGVTAAKVAFSGATTVASGVMAVATGAATALRTALSLMLGPVGWVTAGIGAIAGAAVGFVRWLRRSSAEAEALKEDTEALSEATENLAEEVESSAEAYQENQDSIQNNARANQDLVRRIDELSRKENKSAADKQMLEGYIGRLNDSVDDLNLSYDENADALNMSTEELEARVGVMKEEERMISAQERLMEIEEERNQIGLQLDEINKLREEWNDKLDEGSVKTREHKKAIEDLDEQEQTLKDTLDELGIQFTETEGIVEEAANNMEAIIEEANLRSIESYKDLEGDMKDTFDDMASHYEELRDAATDAFDRINDESKVSMDEMIENLEHNQEMTEKWGENQAELLEWAAENGYEGFMHFIDQMGIDNAAELQVIADSTEDEMIRLAEALEDGAETGTEAFNKKAGEGFDNFMDLLVDFVDDTSTTTRGELEKAGFDDIGKEVPDKIGEGVEDNEQSATRALNSLITNLIEQFDEKARSRVAEIGADFIGGFEGGILSRESSLLSTVRRFAGNVTRTFEDRFQIRSPSRVMAEMAKHIPEGIAVGITANADEAYDAMSKLSDGMIRMSTPEMALGTNRMAYPTSIAPSFAGAGSGSVASQRPQTTNVNVEAGDVILDGRKVGTVVWRPVKEHIDRDERTHQKFRG